MWEDKRKPQVTCSECRTRLPSQAEACPECGYPVIEAGASSASDGAAQVSQTLTEYRLIRLLGIVVFSAGVLAALAESPIAATVAIVIGAATYMTGLLGSWWNSGD